MLLSANFISTFHSYLQPMAVPNVHYCIFVAHEKRDSHWTQANIALKERVNTVFFIRKGKHIQYYLATWAIKCTSLAILLAFSNVHVSYNYKQLFIGKHL